MNNEIDVNMEEWTNNIATYQEDLDAGAFTELSVNFDDNYQGLYIPRYVEMCIRDSSKRAARSLALAFWFFRR